MKRKLPLVVLLGRTNTGKSTLFNRLSDSSRANTSPIPGTTRDLIFVTVSWRDRSFTLVDTGGLDAGKLDTIEQASADRAHQMLKKADVNVLLIDGRQEITTDDKRLIRLLRRTGHPTIVAINKVDGPAIRNRVSEDAYKLGAPSLMFVSALNGIGTGDLLDEIVAHLSPKAPEPDSHDLAISIIGKTNVGKSSIFNAICGEERVIVTPLPHTTREPQDTLITYRGKRLLFIDTAGLRRKHQRSDVVERTSVMKTEQMIARSDICCIVTDVSQPLSSQDSSIARLALERRNGIILVANKWDLVSQKDPLTIAKYTDYYRRQFTGLSWAPIIFTAATKRQRVSALINLTLRVAAELHRTLSPDELSQFVSRLPVKRGKGTIKASSESALHLEQTGTNPPTFLLKSRKRDHLHPAFCNLVERRLRQHFGFDGVPLSITLES